MEYARVECSNDVMEEVSSGSTSLKCDKWGS